jgi:hypothetical protein
MAGFYAINTQPWAASSLFSAAPPGPPLLPHVLSPEEVTQILLDHGAAIRGIHEELALLCEHLIGRLPPQRASLLASWAAALPTPSTGPFTVETTEKMLTRQVSAAVQLQAAAHGLLARRQVGRLLDLQLIQPCTLPQFLQVVRRHTKPATMTAQLQAALRLQAAARLPSTATTTKGAQADAGSGGILGGGRVRLRCRGMRPRLTRWLPAVVPIRCCVQGCT